MMSTKKVISLLVVVVLVLGLFSTAVWAAEKNQTDPLLVTEEANNDIDNATCVTESPSMPINDNDNDNTARVTEDPSIPVNDNDNDNTACVTEDTSMPVPVKVIYEDENDKNGLRPHDLNFALVGCNDGHEHGKLTVRGEGFFKFPKAKPGRYSVKLLNASTNFRAAYDTYIVCGQDGSFIVKNVLKKHVFAKKPFVPFQHCDCKHDHSKCKLLNCECQFGCENGVNPDDCVKPDTSVKPEMGVNVNPLIPVAGV